MNGTNISISQAPHQILIRGTDDGGGSIIAKRWILTAAHLNIGSSTEFYAGVDDRGNLSVGQQKSLDTDKRFKHPNYSGNPNYNNDLALVKVNSDFSFNGNVEIIKLASSSNSSLWDVNKKPYVSGFGHTVSGGSVSNTLKRAAVKVTLVNSANNKIIAGGNYNGTNYDACQGDSGGPLYASTNPNSSSSEFNVLIGTVNGGTGCGGGGAYINVSKYLEWIVRTIHTEDTPNFLCGGTTIVLENIGKLPDGCTMTWSVLEPTFFSTVQTNASTAGSGLTPTLTLTTANGVSGKTTVRITLQIVGEGTKIIDKEMWVGSPAISIVTDGTFSFTGNNTSVCKSFGYCMNATPNPFPLTGSVSYAWNTSSFPNTNSFANPNNAQLCFGIGYTGTYLLKVNSNGTCGTNQRNLFINVNNCGYRVYPNPATSLVNIDFENPEQPESIPTSVEIYDEKNQKKLKSFDWSKSKSKKKEIDVSDLPRGTHYIKLYFDKKKEIETVRLILE